MLLRNVEIENLRFYNISVNYPDKITFLEVLIKPVVRGFFSSKSI